MIDATRADGTVQASAHLPMTLACALLGSLLGACSSSDETAIAATPREAGPEENPPVDASAVLVSTFVRNPEGRNIYVGAVTELPAGDLDDSRFLEFSDIDAMTYDGYAFVWDRETSVMTRFSVDADLTFQEGPRLSFANEGSFADAGLHVFISKTRAYSLSGVLDGLVVWNPQTMEIVENIAIDLPDIDTSLSPSVRPGFLAGDQVVWPISWQNRDTVTMRPSAAVLIASATGDTPAQLVEDPRCIGGDGGHADERGDFYLYATAGYGRYAGYGDGAATARTCVLRIRDGQSAFDSSFMQDIRALTGTYLTRGMFHVRGSQHLIYSWDTARTLPDDPAEFHNANTFRPLLVDVAAGTALPYPHVHGGPLVSLSQHELDGTPYHQQSGDGSETGSDVGSATAVVELQPDGAPLRFTVASGTLWGLGRLR